MKYAVLVGDGMCDYPLKELDEKTPLEVAKIPHMNFIAKEGINGLVKTIPSHMSAGSDVANLSILGYDPVKYYTGRGPLEAANLEIELTDEDYAFRCNLITESDGILVDYSAGHITNKEARALMEVIDKNLSTDKIKFYAGISYRNLMKITVEEGDFTPHCEAPHDIMGEEINRHLPKGKGAQILIDLMMKSRELLSDHAINQVRIDLKENPANMIWLWGQGKTPKLEKFFEKFSLNGAIISAVDLIKGIGKTIGFEVVEVPGATGYYDTNYEAKADYALRALEAKDFVFVHVEAPDEAGHAGDLRTKISSIENFDSKVVGRILKGLKKRQEEFKILVLADHATPISVKTHTPDPVCFAIYGSGISKDSIESFNEKSAKDSQLKFKKGNQLLEFFLKGKCS
jgi:2,3-bisphosphoglycerate-independent phosphoglycerate mutase